MELARRPLWEARHDDSLHGPRSLGRSFPAPAGTTGFRTARQGNPLAVQGLTAAQDTLADCIQRSTFSEGALLQSLGEPR